jgi:hypothetical protein
VSKRLPITAEQARLGDYPGNADTLWYKDPDLEAMGLSCMFEIVDILFRHRNGCVVLVLENREVHVEPTRTLYYEQ